MIVKASISLTIYLALRFEIYAHTYPGTYVKGCKPWHRISLTRLFSFFLVFLLDFVKTNFNDRGILLLKTWLSAGTFEASFPQSCISHHLRFKSMCQVWRENNIRRSFLVIDDSLFFKLTLILLSFTMSGDLGWRPKFSDFFLIRNGNHEKPMSEIFLIFRRSFECYWWWSW